MPVHPSATTILTAFDNVPAFARGHVRDLRIRWALEEIGRDYTPQFLDAMAPKPAEYRDWQPFGQVPAFDDGTVRLFESGAILLYLGEQDQRLLPRDPAGRWNATSWLIAALNSVEPMVMQIVNLDVFQAGKPWAAEARPSTVEQVKARLKSTERALGDKQWIADDFSVADIAMITVLRNLDGSELLDRFPGLAEYKARGEQRPSFERALADQLAGFRQPA
jgi:Glutathione S-transferase